MVDTQFILDHAKQVFPLTPNVSVLTTNSSTWTFPVIKSASKPSAPTNLEYNSVRIDLQRFVFDDGAVLWLAMIPPDTLVAKVEAAP